MKEYLESYAREINSKFRRLNNLISHSATIGGYHEFIIRAFLRNFLSKKYGVKTGFIYNPETKLVSKQIDVLIIDESASAPYFFVEEDLVVVDPKNVRCAIEVKTSFNQANFEGALENHVSILKTGSKCLSIIFAFTSNSNLHTSFGSWAQTISAELHEVKNYPPAIFVMDRGIIQLVVSTLADPWGYYLMEPIPDTQSFDSYVTSQFLAAIVKALDRFSGLETNPFALYAPADSFVNHTCYRFGQDPVPGKILSLHAAPASFTNSKQADT